MNDELCSGVIVGSGGLKRTVRFGRAGISTVGLAVEGAELLAGGREFSFQASASLAGGPPAGLRRETAGVIETEEAFDGTDLLSVTETSGAERDAEESRSWGWGPAAVVAGRASGDCCCGPGAVAVERRRESSGLVSYRFALTDLFLPGGIALTVHLCYEEYPSDPAIRKRIEIRNDSSVWVKLERLNIDDIELNNVHVHPEELTPSERGAVSGIVAYGNEEGTRGVIVGSEVPSALRSMTGKGGTGYRGELFEWVLGPGETFASEAVFMYGYAGDAETTGAGISRPLDRTVENAFVPFLQRELGVAAAPVESLAPLWCTWSNFHIRINDKIVREQAELAARAGFKAVILDMGWQRGLLGTEPDRRKFPDFRRTCEHIRSLGLRLGLWVSCFRDPDSGDMAAWPDAPSLPLLKRLNGYGMSFAGPWRRYYAEDLARLAAECGVSYYKQDFTSIKFGDRAEGHESRTRKESLLRGLRGLLEAQQAAAARAPGIVMEITHEIYWGTPGAPCDVAALRHAGMYHIPPNDYSGAGNRRRRVSPLSPADPDRLRQELIRGCFNARLRLYAHRGLPLRALSYYGAATVSIRGSLTPDIQDRQICSWLMGAPLIFAGDLSSLSERNLQHYRSRFELLERLQREYGIYRHFQFSGVPGPTDTDWHWWGKLNGDGEGAVVVMRGSGGEESRPIVIPWADESQTYLVHACLGGAKPKSDPVASTGADPSAGASASVGVSVDAGMAANVSVGAGTAAGAGTVMGVFTGGQLRRGALVLTLPVFGQELLELKKRP